MAATGVIAWNAPPVFARFAAEDDHAGADDSAWAHRIVSVDRLPQLDADLERVEHRGWLSNNEVFRSYIADFDYRPPEALPGARSIVVVARRQRITQIDFHFRGEIHRVLIPTGYVRSIPGAEAVEAYVRASVVTDQRFRLERSFNLPLKTLAARSGLTQYGKNNIAYVNGMGSLHALSAFYTDQEFEVYDWHTMRMMHICNGCEICVKKCPTRCIKNDRFVIRVEECLALYSELPDPIPEWIDTSAHNALVGCLHCQYTCPANERFVEERNVLEDITAEETEMLVTGAEDETLRLSIEAKLERFGLVTDLAHLARNLKFLLPV